MQGKKLMPKLRGHKLTKDWKMQEQRSWLFFYHFVLLLLPYSLLQHFPISSRAILIFSRFSSPAVSVAPSGALKMQDQKMQDLKMEDQVAGVENAGPENAGPPVNTANR